MNTKGYESLSTAINALTVKGFTDDFKAEKNCIKALYSKREYQPDELTIVSTFRFEGDSNPPIEILPIEEGEEEDVDL